MSDTKDEIYNFIEEYIEKHRLPPTRREIAAAIGVSLNTVQYHIAALEEEGMITRLPGLSRGILPNE